MAYTIIDDPSAYFHTQLFTGNGSTQSITNNANSGDFKPDWLWIKSRGSNHGYGVFDSNRGGNARLDTSATQEERTNEGNVTFQTNGFNVTSSHPTTNNSSTNMVAWQWIANGGTTANNTSGDIGTSVVQANTTVGISIVLYTGNNTGGSTVGHGLGGVPEWIIAKSRAAAKPWVVYHVGMGNTKSIKLNATDAAATDSSSWGNTTPSSTTFTLGNGDSNHTGTMLAYCFRSIQGYSKFGSYTGNGDANGAFVYTGFKPAWLMVKRSSDAQGWIIWDSKRDTFNTADAPLTASESSGEDDKEVDLLSNGFKFRSADTATNAASTYIYMCFASSPLVGSDGTPCTAR